MKQTDEEHKKSQQLKLACPLLTEMHTVLTWHHDQQGAGVCGGVVENKDLENHLTLEAEKQQNFLTFHLHLDSM